MLTIKDLQYLVGIARRTFPNAIIAGGAVRDLVCGAPVRDIDLFVGTENPHDYEGENSRFAMFCDHFAYVVNCEVEFDNSDPDYGNLLDLCRLISKTPLHPQSLPRHGWSGYNFDIVCIPDDPIDDVPNYDFVLSQMFVTERGLFMTRAAARDLADNMLTFTPVILPDAFSVIRSRKRLERLRTKYPSRMLLNCAGLFNIPDTLDGTDLEGIPGWLKAFNSLSVSFGDRNDMV